MPHIGRATPQQVLQAGALFHGRGGAGGERCVTGVLYGIS